VYPLVGEAGAVEVLGERCFGRSDDEVDDLDGGVDNSE